MMLIDSRENSVLSDLVEDKSKKMNLSFDKRWLDVGDYVIGDVCIEAKSTADFLLSVMNKRLWNQIDNMDRNYKTPIVLVYGEMEHAIEVAQYSNMNRFFLQNKFYGGLTYVALDKDAQIFWVPDTTIAAYLICTIAKMQPIEREVKSPRIIKKINTEDVRIDSLIIIQGVSVKKAKALLKKFGCLMEIGDSSIEELISVEGIGKITAERILNVMNGLERIEQ